ncbi:MAG TPA: mechanosensitive ion channel [Tenuifilaceae bacterium]|nr:mechanosensitive ion channel [Tenuifilaceae bacterium]HPN20267.1 mechanosensitive ion channel [Tenuifilaceae bacterium]
MQLPVEKIEEQIVEKYNFLENLEAWLLNQGVNETFAQFFKVTISVGVIVILAIIADFVAKRIFLASMARIAKRTETEWDDILVEKKFFHRLAHFAPAIVFYLTIGVALYDYSPKVTVFLQALTKIYMVIAALLVVNSFLDTVNEIYQGLPYAKSRPIKGYLQVIKIILYTFGAIVIIGIIINKNPSSILVGLGASTAILMLVFKDTITGLVASIQLSANDMLKIGDWIEMPSRNLDGTVKDISLTTVKVQNFDNTITTIPPFALINESFKNWRGMEESDGRRIKRSVYIDVKTIKFCTPEMLQKYKRIPSITEYIESLIPSGIDYTDQAMMLSAGMPTNLSIFRFYIETYLKTNPMINQNATLIVRLLQSLEYGIPLEIYCFTEDKRFVQFEKIQSDVLDHIMAALPIFELKVFQRMSSDDIRAIAQGN